MTQQEWMMQQERLRLLAEAQLRGGPAPSQMAMMHPQQAQRIQNYNQFGSSTVSPPAPPRITPQQVMQQSQMLPSPPRPPSPPPSPSPQQAGQQGPSEWGRFFQNIMAQQQAQQAQQQAQARANARPVMPGSQAPVGNAGGGSFQIPRIMNTMPSSPLVGSGGNPSGGAYMGPMPGSGFVDPRILVQQNAMRAAFNRNQREADPRNSPEARARRLDTSAPVRRGRAQNQARRDQRDTEQRQRQMDMERERQFQERMDMQRRFQEAQDQARQANEQRYQDILSDYGDSRRDAADRYDASTANIDARYTAARDAFGNLTGQARQDADQRYGDRAEEGIGIARENAASLDKEHRDRQRRAEALLRNSGMQERADIAQQSRDAQGAVSNNMVSRGLAGTSLAPSLMAGVQRDRYAAEGRLNDRLRAEQLGVHSQMSGDRLGAAERGGQNVLSTFGALTGDQQAAIDRLMQQNLGVQAGMLQGQTSAAISNDATRNQVLTGMDADRRGFMERRTDAYPDPNMLMQGMNNMANAPTPGTLPTRPSTRPVASRYAAQTVNTRRIPSFSYGGRMPFTGTAQVGERGPELAQLPNGQQQMLGQRGPQYAKLPQGTQVYSPEQTNHLRQQFLQQLGQGPGSMHPMIQGAIGAYNQMPAVTGVGALFNNPTRQPTFHTGGGGGFGSGGLKRPGAGIGSARPKPVGIRPKVGAVRSGY